MWPGPLRLLASKAQEADGSSVCCGVWPCPSSSLALQSSAEYSWLASRPAALCPAGPQGCGVGFYFFQLSTAGWQPAPSSAQTLPPIPAPHSPARIKHEDLLLLKQLLGSLQASS